MFKKALLASAAVMAAGVASAEVTGNFAITSDYIFRGVSFGQAVQGGLDWSNGSGLYAGVWMSNTADDGAQSADEIDYYAGYGLGLSDGLSLDFGIINYNTDSNEAGDLTVNELYLGVAGEAWDATLYYGDRDDAADGATAEEKKTDNYLYLDLNYSIACGETTSVDLHLGYLDEDAKNNDEFLDAYDVSVTYNIGDFGIGLSYRDADQAAGDPQDPGNDEKAQLFVSWGTEFDVK
jgi:uncharacterized protein (TIGR02001 family)